VGLEGRIDSAVDNKVVNVPRANPWVPRRFWLVLKELIASEVASVSEN
jgi:hypothetical protein